MMTTTRITVSSLLVCGTLAATGCGTADPASVSAAGSAIRTNATGRFQVPGDGPVDTAVAIDRTAIMAGDRDLARQYRAAVLTAIEPTVTRGGLLTIRMFGRASARSLDIRTQQVPTLEEQDAVHRHAGEQRLREGVGAALDVALGIEAASGAAGRTISKVTDGSGSDIARAVGNGVAAAGSGDAPAKVAVVLTDGLVNDGDVVVGSTQGTASVKALGRQVAGDTGLGAGTRRIQLLRIAGIGAISGRPALAPGAIDRLVAIWRVACDRLPAESCEIAPTP